MPSPTSAHAHQGGNADQEDDPGHHPGVSLAASAAPRGSRGSSSRASSSEELESKSSHGDCSSPMDLSSGNASETVRPVVNDSTDSVSKFHDHPLLNAKRFAEYVKAQQLQKLADAGLTSKIWESQQEPKIVKESEAKPLIPLEHIRNKWEDRASPESSGSHSSSSGTPPYNNNGNGREDKKRRLDALLSKKFALADSPPQAQQEDEVNNGSNNNTMLAALINPSERRSSNERKINRRKKSTTPPTLAVRPTSDLLIENSVKSERSPVHSPLKIDTSPVELKSKPVKQPSPPAKKQQTPEQALKSHIMQLQLAQAALMSNAGSNQQNAEFLKTALMSAATGPLSQAMQAANPLLYYAHYAQLMQQGLGGNPALGLLASASANMNKSPVANADKSRKRKTPVNNNQRPSNHLASSLSASGHLSFLAKKEEECSPSKKANLSLESTPFKLPRTEVS